MKVSPHPDADSQAVMDSIRRIVHALEVGSRAAQKRVGLSGAQLFVLQTLAAGGSMSVNELATHTHTHQSSVSVVISRLVEAKLVRRTASAADARRLEIAVTAAGRRVLTSNLVTPQQRLIDSLRRLAPGRLKTLRLLLREVVENSGMDSATVPMFFEERERGRRNAPLPAVKAESKGRVK